MGVAPGVPTIDVVETGKVMARLQDFQLILYVFVLIFVVLVGERIWAGWSMRREREKMWEVADKFGAAAEKLGEQTNKLVVELQVLRALASRVESVTDDGRK